MICRLWTHLATLSPCVKCCSPLATWTQYSTVQYNTVQYSTVQSPGHLDAVPAHEGEGEGEGAEHQAPEHKLLHLLPPVVLINNNRWR